MHSLTTTKKAVGFKGLDWEFEKSKLEQRFQRRREKKQSKLSKMSLAANIKNFLEHAKNDNKLCQLDEGVSALKKSKEVYNGELPFDTLDVGAKVQHLLERLNAGELGDKIQYVIAAWMAEAKDLGLYRYSEADNDSELSSSDDGGLNPLTDVEARMVNARRVWINMPIIEELADYGVTCAYAVCKALVSKKSQQCSTLLKIFNDNDFFWRAYENAGKLDDDTLETYRERVEKKTEDCDGDDQYGMQLTSIDSSSQDSASVNSKASFVAPIEAAANKAIAQKEELLDLDQEKRNFIREYILKQK